MPDGNSPPKRASSSCPFHVVRSLCPACAETDEAIAIESALILRNDEGFIMVKRIREGREVDKVGQREDSANPMSCQLCHDWQHSEARAIEMDTDAARAPMKRLKNVQARRTRTSPALAVTDRLQLPQSSRVAECALQARDSDSQVARVVHCLSPVDRPAPTR